MAGPRDLGPAAPLQSSAGVMNASPDGGGSRGLTRSGARALNAVPPPILVLLAIVSIQIGAALAVRLFAAVEPPGVVFLRVALSAILLVLASRPALDRTVRRHSGLLLLYGLVLAVMNYGFYEAIARIPLGVAVTIDFMGPLAVAVATSRRRLDFLWIALAILGIAMLMPEIGGRLDPVGVMYAGMAAVGWAGFVLLSRRVGRIFVGGDGLALGMVVAAVFLAPFGLLKSSPVLFDPALAITATAIAVLSTAIPLSLEFAALKRMPPKTYGVLVTLEPAVAVLVGAVLLSEWVGATGIVAVCCVTAAAVGATLFADRAGN